MGRYKVVKCRYCGRIYMTQAFKTSTCPFCGRKNPLSALYKHKNILYESDEWSKAQHYIDEYYTRDSFEYAKKRFISRSKEMV